MRDGLIGIIVAFIILTMLSFTDTKGKTYPYNDNINNFDIPLKQRDVTVTSDYKKMKELIKKGYVVEDVDFAFSSSTSHSKFYTLILY